MKLKPDISNLIADINGRFVQAAKNDSSAKNAKVYDSEPIIKTASQLKNYTPEKILAMRKLARAIDKSGREIFHMQAEFMEDYEDDCPYNKVMLYTPPSYESLTNAQLRGYFTWRAGYRKGVDMEDTPHSFIYLYALEIINGIGISSPEQGYHILTSLSDKLTYPEGEPQRLLIPWIRDYVVYNNLPASFFPRDDGSYIYEKLERIYRCEEYDDDELFEGIKSLSSYNIENSRFFSAYPDDMKRVLCGLVRRLSELCEKNNKRSFFESMFGSVVRIPYKMFPSALFFEKAPHPDCEYIIDSFNMYFCRNGLWSTTKIYDLHVKSKPLALLIKAAESEMRKRYSFKHPLKAPESSGFEKEAILQQIDDLFKEKSNRMLEEVRIDRSKLSEIRMSAERTREMLITDEDGLQEQEQSAEQKRCVPENTAVADDAKNAQGATDDTVSGAASADKERLCPTIEEPDKPDSAFAPERGLQGPSLQGDNSIAGEELTDLGLSERELILLHALLWHEEYSEKIKKAGSTVALTVDSINEKLYERFGDTVIIYDADTPSVADDYVDELKGIVVK